MKISIKKGAKKYVINDIIDWFGKNITFSDVSEEWLTVDADVNETAMYRWALQYAEHIVIISPQTLKNNVYEGLKRSLKLYEEEI